MVKLDFVDSAPANGAAGVNGDAASGVEMQQVKVHLDGDDGNGDPCGPCAGLEGEELVRCQVRGCCIWLFELGPRSALQSIVFGST